MTDQERLTYWWNRAIEAERILDKMDRILGDKTAHSFADDETVFQLVKVLNDYFE
jgi:hypothetical protein